MTCPRRAGFTMVEVMVVMAITGLVTAGLFQLHHSHRRMIDWQLEAAAVHDAYRVASSLLAGDLREAVPGAGDLDIPRGDSLVVRAPVGLAFVCATRTGPDALALQGVTGRPPDTVGDSLFVYADGGWVETAVAEVESPGSRGMSCAHGASRPEAQVRVAGSFVAGVPVGAPIRTYRRHAYHRSRNGGETWLARTTPDGTEPLVGPLSDLAFLPVRADGSAAPSIQDAVGVQFRMVLGTGPTRDTIEALFRLRTP